MSTKKMHNKELGARGEIAAQKFLKAHGYDILEKNWKCFAGEADIIALDDETLVFVEVKTRSDCTRGFPAEAVSAAKRDKYEKIALMYLSEHDFTERPVRFDVVSIVAATKDRAMVKLHKNAFARD